MNRTELFNKLNAKPTNPYWSWCAMHENKEFAVFTIWDDRTIKGRNSLTPENRDNRNTNGYRDQERVIHEVRSLNIPTYGVLCTVKDRSARPRKIKRVHSDYLIRLELVDEGEFTYAVHRGKLHVLDVINNLNDSAINDLNSAPPVGCVSPDRALSVGLTFKRDPKVRGHVIERAKGHCEFCGKQGFQMTNGYHYVEAHHIITLSEQGEDTLSNVIALCPDHHREAHYGRNAAELEAKFLMVLQKLS